MSTEQLVKDVATLAKRLAKFHEFYYALIEAKYISLGVQEFSKATIEVIQVDKAEWERWQKVKSIIEKFEVPS